jgi:peptide/nickel transport system permease protein
VSGYLVRRLIHSVVVLWVVLSFVFVAGRMIGDPALMLLGPGATAADILSMREAMGLSDPLIVQYVRFLANAVQGDFGITFRYGFSYVTSTTAAQGQATLPLVLERLPATFLLAAVAITIAVLAAFPLGIVAAMRPRSLWDRLANTLSLACVSMVQFWLGFMLILLFAVQLGLLPTSGYGGLQHAILPAITLAFRPIGRLTQIVRSAMLDELARPYIDAARAKGLSETRIVLRHALKNASIPIVTILGDETTTVIMGAIVVELVFAWPGIGLLLVDALGRRDLPLVEACMFVIALVVITMNLIVDLAYTWLDPKLRLA